MTFTLPDWSRQPVPLRETTNSFRGPMNALASTAREGARITVHNNRLQRTALRAAAAPER